MKSWLKGLSLSCLSVGLSLSQLNAEELSTEYISQKQPHKQSKESAPYKRSQILKNNDFLNPSSAFFQFNPGIGLVYFSGVRGDLSGQPKEDYQPYNYTPLKRKLIVNRGPAFESILGYRFNSWFSLGASYFYQGQLAVKSVLCPSVNAESTGNSISSAYSQFQSDLSLNAIYAKFYLQTPSSWIWRSFAFTPYLGAAVGAGWQTWSRIVINRQFSGLGSNIFFSEPQYIRQKISANVSWMVDVGFNALRVSPKTDFSVVAGCKFIDFGQAKSMGKITQQGSFKGGLIHPVSIKMLYAFNPYLGVQWNFPTASYSNKMLEVAGRNSNVWKLYFASLKCVESKKSGFVQLNVGPNFLYYSKVRGNLFGRPDTNFGVWGDVPIKGLLQANKAPLLEAIWGYQFAPWIKGAISYQHLAGVTVQTKMLNGQSLDGVGGVNDYSQFQGNLAIDALLLKAYFQLPRAMILKNTATSPYLALGGGASWQSWTRMQVNRCDLDSVGYNADPQPIRQKIMANGSFLVDIGFRTQSVAPQNNFSVSLGCKYNQWGQVRNIGKLSEQGSLIKGLNHPFRVKVLYSFTPYMGAQWSFPLISQRSAIPKIRGISIARFKPFYTHSRNIQAQQSPFIQFNVGLGLLYFDKIQGSLTGTPTSDFIVYGPIALKQGMIYNRSPLFEYLLGYRFNQWFKLALSYQYQGGVTFQTQILDALNPDNLGQNFDSRHSQFQANVALNSVMAKFYFELPYPMVSTGCAFVPYLAVGAGPGWQSWTQIQVNRMYDISSFVSEPQSLRQKISANATWMLDLGFRMQSASPCSPFSVTLGCKYNQWGQARSMGAVKNQDTVKSGLIQPIHIKTVYSFAPYMGMQWNF